MMQKTRLSPNQAARYIGCSYDKLLQMVRAGEVPHYRIGARVFFTQEKLAAWIDGLENESVTKGAL